MSSDFLRPFNLPHFPASLPVCNKTTKYHIWSGNKVKVRYINWEPEHDRADNGTHLYFTDKQKTDKLRAIQSPIFQNNNTCSTEIPCRGIEDLLFSHVAPIYNSKNWAC